MEKVLIGCPVNERKQYCVGDYLINVTNFTYLSKDFYFCDNSHDATWHVKNFLLKGYNCGYVSPNKKQNHHYVTESFNKIREYFLQSDCDYWLCLEIDLFPPPDIIESMLAYNEQIVSARYFIGDGKDSRLMSMEFDDTFQPNTNRNMTLTENFVEYGSGKTISGSSGLGCLLIHKDVMRQITFFISDEEYTHADTYFSRTLDFFDIPVTYHDEIIEHRSQNWNYVTDYKK